MYITITIENDDKRFDIKTDNRQVIRNCIEIMKTNGVFSGDVSDFLRSYLNNKVISSYETFEDAGIHSGDILSVERLEAVRK